MFFKNHRVLKHLLREGFSIADIWMDAVSTRDDRAYVGLKLIDEPNEQIAKLDLSEAVADWASVALFNPIGGDAIIVLLVVEVPNYGMAMPI